jgi:glycerol uptake facilitator-like aquaporin
MHQLLGDIGFWFGAAVLGVHQIGRFNELSASDAALSARSALIPNLRVSDFTGRFTYCATLTAFLAVSVVIYFLLCLVTPDILRGWAQVSGASPESFDAYLKSVPFPLYIAAAFMGLTQSTIPVLSHLGDMQRSLFHELIGVPKRVVAASQYFSNQLFARSSGSRGLANQVMELVSDSWLERIDRYADSVFYRHQLARMKLDDEAELKERLRGSKPELRNLTGQLVYAAALATVRESGVKSLAQLAEDLKVTLPRVSTRVQDFFAGGILFLIGMTLLWSIIPMLDPLAARYLIPAGGIDLWPNKPSFAGPYVTGQLIPIFITTGLALAAWTGAFSRPGARRLAKRPAANPVAAIFDRYVGLFVGVILVVVVYDLFQAFFEYGLYDEGRTNSVWSFLRSNVHYFLLHSFISIVICFFVLLHVEDRAKTKGTPKRIAMLLAGVGTLSLFYAVARLRYQYGYPSGAGTDYVVLVVGLNLVGALLALAAATVYSRRHASQDEEAILSGTEAVEAAVAEETVAANLLTLTPISPEPAVAARARAKPALHKKRPSASVRSPARRRRTSSPKACENEASAVAPPKTEKAQAGRRRRATPK